MGIATLAGGCFWCTESIQITFDPKVISFEKLLDVFWATHNPTTKDRQNYDVGPKKLYQNFKDDLKPTS